MWLEANATDSGDFASSLRRLNFIILLPLLLLAACSGKIRSSDEFRRAGEEMHRCAREMAERNKEIRDLLQAYNQTVPTQHRLLVASAFGAMTAMERGTLASHMSAETDESCRSVLDRVQEIDAAMERARDKFNSLAARLPEPHRVRQGENHYQICQSYLLHRCGLPRCTADSIVAGVQLSPDLYEGFDVWMFYSERHFDTFVTQGDARIAPAPVAGTGSMSRH